MSTACTSEIALSFPWRLSLELLLAAPLASVGAAPARVLGEEHDGEMAALVVLPPDPPKVDVQTLLHNFQHPEHVSLFPLALRRMNLRYH